MPATKIVTCCYCGTKAALVLRGKNHHELSCSTCGAPLQAMKMLPIGPVAGSGRATASSTTPTHPKPSKPYRTKARKPSKRRKRKSFKERAWEEFWDAIEDIFD